MDHPLFEQSVETILPEVKRQLMSGAEKVVLTVARWEDDTRVSVFCEPEFKE
jgi:hypothetical protein